MKNLSAIALLVFIGFAGWQVGSLMDTDTTAIVVGFVLGALASIPVGLLLIVADRRRERQHNGNNGVRQRNPYPAEHTQPIVILQPPYQQAQPAPSQPTPAQDNRWMVTGGGAIDDMPTPTQDSRFRTTTNKQ